MCCPESFGPLGNYKITFYIKTHENFMIRIHRHLLFNLAGCGIQEGPAYTTTLGQSMAP